MKNFKIGQYVIWDCKEPWCSKKIKAEIVSFDSIKNEYVAFTKNNKDIGDNGLYLVIDKDTAEDFYIDPLDNIVDFFESNKCRISKIENAETFELEIITPAGEDWIFCIPYCQNFTELSITLHDAYKNFDIDENADIYISSRGKNGIPNSISTILEDQHWKKKKLELLYRESIRNMREKGGLYV